MNFDPIAPLYAQAKHKISILGMACWLYLVIQLCVSAAAGGLFGAATASVMNGMGYSMLSVLNIAVLLIVTPVSGGLSVWFVADNLKLTYKDQFRTGFRKLDIVDGLGVLLLFSLTCSLVFSMIDLFLPQGQIAQPDFGYSSNLFSNFLLFVTIVLVGPFFEELFFRATLLRSLTRYGKEFALIFSSLCFGMMHLNFAQGIPAFFMGIVLGWSYVRSGSLIVPIAIHMLNNAISFLGMSVYGTIIASVLIVGLAIYGLVYIVRHASMLRNEIRSAQSDPHFYALALSNPWIIAFIAVYVIASLIGVFVL